MADPVAGAVGGGVHRLQIGLKPLALEDWIEDQPDFAHQLRMRRDLLAHRDDVLARLPGAEEGEHELLGLLLEHLPRALPQHYSERRGWLGVHATGERWRCGESPSRPLEVLARLVPDDLCLLRAGPDGCHRLVSAAVCFPTRWRLGPKLGEPLTAIHAPVPGYAARLGAGVERVFAGLSAARAMWRVNWTLVDSPALYQPERRRDRRPAPSPVELARRLWLRTERQTLRRLPASGWVVFGIRIRQAPLVEACRRDPGLALRLLEQIETMPPPMLRYKGLDAVAPVLRRYLLGAGPDQAP